MSDPTKELFQNFEDRDCPNCVHKMPNGDCNSWACDFVPRPEVVKEVQEYLDNIRRNEK